MDVNEELKIEVRIDVNIEVMVKMQKKVGWGPGVGWSGWK